MGTGCRRRNGDRAIKLSRASANTGKRFSTGWSSRVRTKLMLLWRPPANVRNPEEAVVVVRILLNPDGTLAAPPKVLKSGSSPEFIASRDSALRAINSGQPFTMFKPENYEFWKDIEINFDPREMAPRPN